MDRRAFQGLRDPRARRGLQGRPYDAGGRRPGPAGRRAGQRHPKVSRWATAAGWTARPASAAGSVQAYQIPMARTLARNRLCNSRDLVHWGTAFNPSDSTGVGKSA
ncbi:hypothetical protein GCM10027176_02080 [Actinoallomurus bryophytorum]